MMWEPHTMDDFNVLVQLHVPVRNLPVAQSIRSRAATSEPWVRIASQQHFLIVCVYSSYLVLLFHEFVFVVNYSRFTQCVYNVTYQMEWWEYNQDAHSGQGSWNFGVDSCASSLCQFTDFFSVLSLYFIFGTCSPINYFYLSKSPYSFVTAL